MTDLAKLAEDLLYAGGPGASQIANQVTHGARIEAEIGQQLQHLGRPFRPGGRAQARQTSQGLSTQALETVADHAAAQAANLGAQAVTVGVL